MSAIAKLHKISPSIAKKMSHQRLGCVSCSAHNVLFQLWCTQSRDGNSGVYTLFDVWRGARFWLIVPRTYTQMSPCARFFVFACRAPQTISAENVGLRIASDAVARLVLLLAMRSHGTSEEHGRDPTLFDMTLFDGLTRHAMLKRKML